MNKLSLKYIVNITGPFINYIDGSVYDLRDQKPTDQVQVWFMENYQRTKVMLRLDKIKNTREYMPLILGVENDWLPWLFEYKLLNYIEGEKQFYK